MYSRIAELVGLSADERAAKYGTMVRRTLVMVVVERESGMVRTWVEKRRRGSRIVGLVRMKVRRLIGGGGWLGSCCGGEWRDGYAA